MTGCSGSDGDTESPTASASAPQAVETAVVSATPVAAETPATPTGSVDGGRRHP
ncbi:hypothetical protein [Parafrankia soli]|uniref:hypothetical protein n=1 Tax=Parafrankia soli TaxID=2599596 RepID=UPI000AE01931|nr:hypothetical protein [Parafrankia soli]